MTRHAEDVLQAALTLPDEDRAEIAGALLESLEPSTEAEVERAWRQEVAARVAALDAGEVETIPWSEVRDHLRTRLGAGRRD
jgi:putative addiction module component (TIGR02574 family)